MIARTFAPAESYLDTGNRHAFDSGEHTAAAATIG